MLQLIVVFVCFIMYMRYASKCNLSLPIIMIAGFGGALLAALATFVMGSFGRFFYNPEVQDWPALVLFLSAYLFGIPYALSLFARLAFQDCKKIVCVQCNTKNHPWKGACKNCGTKFTAAKGESDYDRQVRMAANARIATRSYRIKKKNQAVDEDQ